MSQLNVKVIVIEMCKKKCIIQDENALEKLEIMCFKRNRYDTEHSIDKKFNDDGCNLEG